MNNDFEKRHHEKGQVIPILVIGLFVSVIMAALLVDGGALMANKRQAQAAADAGALAGAQRLCTGQLDWKTVAETYAENYNGATHADANSNLEKTEVTVVAEITYSSFFASIIGYPTLTASADATAGCYTVRGSDVVPIAFYCRKDAIGEVNPTEGKYECVLWTLDWATQLSPILKGSTVKIGEKDYYLVGTNIVDSDGKPPLKYQYIIIDDDKVNNDVCESEGGSIKCDIDVPPDGKDELKFGGNRGWLYLDGVNSILSYVKKGPKTAIEIVDHKWLSGDPGVEASIYGEMITAYAGKIVLVPIYNYLCPGDPRTDQTCIDEAHIPDWPPLPENGDDTQHVRSKSNNYHIIEFAPFYVSCVAKNDGDCPGFKEFQKILAADEPSIDLKSQSVVEGYFISNYEVPIDPTHSCALDLGNCIIMLSD